MFWKRALHILFDGVFWLKRRHYPGSVGANIFRQSLLLQFPFGDISNTEFTNVQATMTQSTFFNAHFVSAHYSNTV